MNKNIADDEVVYMWVKVN